jgi:hypothetical protein
MKSAETVLACCVVGLACFIGGQTVGTQSASTAEAAGAFEERPARVTLGAPLTSAAESAVHGEEIVVPATRRSPGAERPSLDPSEMRRRVTRGLEGTYLSELLVSRDSIMARWPDRIGRPLRVFVREGERLDGWNPDFLPVVRDAFDTWSQTGIPVRFTFTADSALADIHVHFHDHFANGISGKTVWSRDANFWLVASEIQLAIQHPAGGMVTPPQMRAIALHEVGHLLGLDHASDAENIMAARVRVRELSEADKSTVRLLYSVPAGSLK